MSFLTLITYFCIEQTLFGEEVEVGGLYELVVTTLSGLYRYRIGDVVKVVRFHNSCPVIEFQYRQGQLLNMRSEKTTETMMYEALTTVLRSKGENFRLVDYTCAESILLDFIPSSKAAIEETNRKQKHDNHTGFGGVKPFYVIFLELSGSTQDATANEILSQEVSLHPLLSISVTADICSVKDKVDLSGWHIRLE